MPDDLIAWHAREDNQTHIGIEFAQPTIDVLPTEFQYAALAYVCGLLCDKYRIPRKRVMGAGVPGIVGHEDTAQGKRDGKSDPGWAFSWEHFLALLNGEQAPVKKQILDHLDFIYAYNNSVGDLLKTYKPALDNIEPVFYTNVQEATRVINERTLAIKDVVLKGGDALA